MTSKFPVIEAGCELEDIRKLLKSSDEAMFPVVDRNQNTILLDEHGNSIDLLSDRNL
jgi:hypothetical protein